MPTIALTIWIGRNAARSGEPDGVGDGAGDSLMGPEPR